MEAPAELGVAAVLVGAARVVAHVQLVAALRHGGDPHVHLAGKRSASAQVKKWEKKLSFFFFFFLKGVFNRTPSGTGRPKKYELHPSGSGIW